MFFHKQCFHGREQYFFIFYRMIAIMASLSKPHILHLHNTIFFFFHHALQSFFKMHNKIDLEKKTKNKEIVLVKIGDFVNAS